MLDPAAIEETMKRVRRLEIRAKRLVNESFAGEYHSSFKGQGLDFDEFREYQHGDEIRFIERQFCAEETQAFEIAQFPERLFEFAIDGERKRRLVAEQPEEDQLVLVDESVCLGPVEQQGVWRVAADQAAAPPDGHEKCFVADRSFGQPI